MGAKKLQVVGPELDVHELSMRTIDVLPDLFQTRFKIDMEVVMKFRDTIRAGLEKAFPPVIVCRLVDGRLILADGFHRHAAHVKAGRQSIRAIVRDVETAEDAFLVGLAANMEQTHFRKPEDDDRKHAVEMMIRNEEFRTWNDAEIGRRCGISSSVVRIVRGVLRTHEGIPFPDRFKCFKDGVFTGRMMVSKNVCTSGKSSPTTLTKRRLGSIPFVNLYGETTEAHRQGMTEDRSQCESFFDNPSYAVGRLMDQGLDARLASDGKSYSLGYILLSDFAVLVVCGGDFYGVRRALGDVLIARKQFPDRRVIVVRRPSGFGGHSGWLVNLARAEPDPIEFLTPEEIVARFAPPPVAPGEGG